MHRPRRLCLCAGTALALAAAAGTPAASADVVIDWNNHLLDTIRATGGPPCPISRAFAMTHTAVYEAVNSIARTHEPYIAYLPASAGASKEAAAAAAAHAVLVHLFPARQPLFDAALADSLADIPDGQAEDDGVALGVAAAAAIIAARAGDGTQTDPIYVFGDQPGDYRPTPPMPYVQPFNPGWGSSTPWTMISGQMFRPAGPLGHTIMSQLLASPGYAEQLNEVKSLGRVDSTTRTPDQTNIAWFWANDRNGTYKPPGHLNHITQVVSQDRGLTLEENARLFALVNIALADAGLVAWDAKYNTDIDLWRPLTAIHLANTDGNPATEPDPDWLPLMDFTPPFPAYISGHATFGATHAAVIAAFFRTDHVTFTIGTDEPFYTGGPRTYHRFSDAGWENAISRVYLGVHFLFDGTDGNIAGTALGRYVAASTLLPVCRGDWNGRDGINSNDISAFIKTWIYSVTHDFPFADVNGDDAVDVADITAFVNQWLADIAGGC